MLSIPPACDDERLGAVLMDALLPIPPVGLMHKLLGPVLMDALLSIPLVSVLEKENRRVTRLVV